MIPRTWYVYALCEPDSGEIRYIGKSTNPSRRLAQHRSPHASGPVRAWAADLSSDPLIRILGEFQDETLALLSEKSLVDAYSTSGRLLNIRAGGGRTFPHKPFCFSGVGARIKSLRRALALTHFNLRDMTGIAQPNISNMETNENASMSAEDAVLIARALGTTVEYLVTGENAAERAA